MPTAQKFPGSRLFCRHLDHATPDLELAIDTLQEVERIWRVFQNRIHTFQADVFARRALGKPRQMLDTKESRDFLQSRPWTDTAKATKYPCQREHFLPLQQVVCGAVFSLFLKTAK